MNTDANKLVIRRLIEEVVNTGDVDRLSEFISPDCRQTNDPTGREVGLEAMRAHVLAFRQTFPDVHLTVEQQVAEGDWVATRITARATHLGPWPGREPTGKRVAINAVDLDRVIDGRVVEHGGAVNMLEALFSIGAIHAAGRCEEGTV